MDLQEEIISILEGSNEAFRPLPDQSVAEWTPKNVFMSTKMGDPYDGPYVPWPYQVEILNCAGDPAVEAITMMTSAQVGKTSMLLIMGCWRIVNRPGGIVFVRETAKATIYLCNSRFDPLVEKSEALTKVVSPKEYKGSKNTSIYKDTLSGFVRFITAGTAGDLKSTPANTIMADEIDEYDEIKGVGDPIALLDDRMARQISPLLVAASTPTVADESRIEKRFEKSDKRRFFVPCPHCKYEQILLFENVKWDSQDFKNCRREMEKLHKKGTFFVPSTHHKTRLHFPDTARYLCVKCGCLMSDFEKNQMVKRGRWVAERPFSGHAGFWLNELYAPMSSMKKLVTKFLESKDDPAARQVFVNGTLGEVYNIPHEAMEQSVLFARREHYSEITPENPALKLPRDGAILTAGVDVHLDRLEVTVRLWGAGYESWGLEYLILFGDPFQDIVWMQLNSLLEKYYAHPCGIKLRIQKCAIDAGYASDRVHTFVHWRKWPAVAILGKSGAGRPVHTGNPSKANNLNVPVYTLGIDTIKNTLYQRSFIKRPGPGYIHWNHHYNEDYFKQFTSERRVRRRTASGMQYVWELPAGRKNEGLDTEVYAYAALHLVGIGDYEGTVKQIVEGNTQKESKETPQEGDQLKPINPFTDDL